MPGPDRDPSGIAGAPRSTDRRNILLIGVGIFFYWTGMYLYVPILPIYARSVGASLSMVGVIVAVYALPQLLLRIPLGVWSDSLGRRKPLIIGGVLMVFLGAAGLIVATNPWLIVAARAAVGVGAAMWVIISVHFVAQYPEGRTARAVGTLYFINSTALVAATLAGGIIADAWGAEATFYGAALLSTVSLAAMGLSRESRQPAHEAVSWGSFTRIATRPLLIVVSVMGVLQAFVHFSGVFGFTPVYAAEIGASKTEIGVVTMLAMAAATVASLGMSHLISWAGYKVTLILSALLMGLATLAVPFVHSVSVLYVVQFANGLGRGVLAASLTALCIRAVAPQQMATAMGLFQAAYAIGMLFGPLLSGFLAEGWGLPAVFYVTGVASLAVVAVAAMRVVPGRGL